MKEYVLSLTCAAILAAVLEAMGLGKMGRLLTGLFLGLVVLSPIRDFRPEFLWQVPQDLYSQGQSIAAAAREDTSHSICDIIIHRTRAYILDEAKALGASVTVTAIALDEETLTPIRVELEGKPTPYQRSCLTEYLTKTLGIGKEGIVWNG